MAKVVYYGGDVQGVGFRATAVSVARHHPLVRGWVRNLPDGRVELLADGPAESVGAFLAEVRESMAGYIRTEDTTDRVSDTTLHRFRVVH
jgi:acylphosphatase